MTKLQDAIDRAWPLAKQRWSRNVRLGAPRLDDSCPAIAAIDLSTRQVVLNGKTILAQGSVDCIEALLAHEVGHHARWPRSLGTQARLRVFEKQIVPLESFSAINLFTDLLINEELGRQGLAAPLARVYRNAGAGGNTAATFLFTLAVYEELWSLAPGSLLGDGEHKLLAIHAHYRSEAHLVAQDLFRVGPNLFTQFLFYLSVLTRYLAQDAEDELQALACHCAAEPSDADWAAALSPSALEEEALGRARAEGWLSEDQLRRLDANEPFERRIQGLPGQLSGAADSVPQIMAAWYRAEAERWLVSPPPQRRLGEAVVPSTLLDWEPGDPVSSTDWNETLRERGPIWGAGAPLKREPIADHEGLEVELWHPRIELYLDVSGSMPDPRISKNAMTLAALILAVGTLRAGGAARALIYSQDYVASWAWCRSSVELSRFLMHYVGGGTAFPFAMLAASTAERDTAPIRAVLTDTDFDHNVDADAAHRDLLRTAAAQSPLILILRAPNPERVKLYQALGARVLSVAELDDFPRVAAGLARALFEDA